MRTLFLVFAVLSSAAVASAQDAIYYKFAAGGGTKVLNFGTADATAPREGTIVPDTNVPLGKHWSAGRYGSGLAPGPSGPRGYRVDTGWRFRVPGDLTLSFFVKMAYALPTNAAGVIVRSTNSQTGFAIYMSGVPSRAGRMTFFWYANGNNYEAVLYKNVYALATKGWTHVALRIDRTKRLATWFLDGKPELPQSIKAWPSILSTETMNVGHPGNGYWHLDEVRVTLRAVLDKEVASWAKNEPAAAAPFGKACRPRGYVALLDGTKGGAPMIGNSNYRLTVFGLPASDVVLALGASNLAIRGVPLPLDMKVFDPMLAGCQLHSSADLLLFRRIGPTGAVPVPLPIPNLPAASGAKLYSQAVLSNSILKTTMLTNAHATVVGN